MDHNQTINVMKGLIIDGVGKANSGHPGGPLSSIDFAYILFSEYLRFDPENPDWLGRDRFVLSAGHESMLLYTLLYFNGWLTLEDLKSFRQWKSRTPGHPENTHTPGVECTTGPLGQGAAMSVGFAVASCHLRKTLCETLFSTKTYALLGDGCMQEDVTLGAASLAGHLKLANLVWYYDRNRVQISGGIERATSDQDAEVFRGFGWQVLEIDGHDHNAIRGALDSSRDQKAPTLIIGHTTIGKGTFSLEGSAKTHGSPLPEDEVKRTKEKLGLSQQAFHVPEDAITQYRQHFNKKSIQVSEWRHRLQILQKDQDFNLRYNQYFSKEKDLKLPNIPWPDKPTATRNVFGDILVHWAPSLPSLVGGSADLEPSNMTEAFAKLVGDFHAQDRPEGRNLVFGVREFPMAAIANGIALHGGLKPFTATFLAFADYSRPALRLGAIQKIGVIHEFTHDSFYLGEDGPTHQPIEHLMSLRVIPEFHVMRPADASETEVMMRVALSLDTPSAMCLTRQKVPQIARTEKQQTQICKGAYIVYGEEKQDCEGIIFATGSEVSLALEVAKRVKEDLNQTFRVVSLPCWELFFKQTQSYQQEIQAPQIKKRISIEAGSTCGWERFVGRSGLMVGIDHFGASAPAEVLAKEYGFTVDGVLRRIVEHPFHQ